jgi:hypothetical protein
MEEVDKEYLCPFCPYSESGTWVEFSLFDKHQFTHSNRDLNGCVEPKSVEDLKSRFQILGLWEERDV